MTQFITRLNYGIFWNSNEYCCRWKLFEIMEIFADANLLVCTCVSWLNFRTKVAWNLLYEKYPCPVFKLFIKIVSKIIFKFWIRNFKINTTCPFACQRWFYASGKLTCWWLGLFFYLQRLLNLPGWVSEAWRWRFANCTFVCLSFP